MTFEPPACDDRAVWDLWLSRLQLPAVTVADEIGLFALLAGGPAPAQEVAARLDLGPRGAEALLAVCAALGFLTQHGGRFGLTDTARHYLLREGDFYWGPMLHRSHGAVAAPGPAAGPAPGRPPGSGAGHPRRGRLGQG